MAKRKSRLRCENDVAGGTDFLGKWEFDSPYPHN